MNAFLTALKSNQKIEETLPMEPTMYWKQYIAPYNTTPVKLSIAGSSYKKMGKFYDSLQQQALLMLDKPKGVDHKLVSAVNYSHAMYSYNKDNKLRMPANNRT